MSCSGCLNIIAQSCTDKLRLVLKLEPNKKLVVYIRDKFETSIYKQGVTTDAEGTVFIDTTKFPKGFFNPHAGDMELTFKEKDDNCALYQFAGPCDSEQLYTCITIRPKEIINTNASGFLQVENSSPGNGYLEQENGGRFIV